VARTSWFDDADLPVIDEQVQKLESFTQAMADGVIEQQELARQQESLVAAMKAVEPELSDAQHGKVTRLLAELSAYNVMRLLHELQARRLQKTFGERER
jgi:predicted transcriptional regulator